MTEPDRAAAELPARDAARCGCADAERTYEQLLDYTADLGAELDRLRAGLRAMARRAVDRHKKSRHYMKEMLKAKGLIGQIAEAAGIPRMLGAPDRAERVVAAVLSLRAEVATDKADRAELDHQRARIAAVLAYLDKVEADTEMFRRCHGGGLMNAIVEVPRIRALLEGEER